MSQPLYALGDIHGQFELLQDALAQIEHDGGGDAAVVFIGDLTDRGPDSRKVIDLLIRQITAGRKWTVIKGNHDRMFTWFMQDHPKMDTELLVGMDWLHPRLGGRTTLASYGLKVDETSRYYQVHAAARAAVPAAHLAFLNALPLSHETKDYLFVHAGIRPKVTLTNQTEHDLLWIREPFLSHCAPHQKFVIHGHTALEAPQLYSNRLNLDGGAGYGRPLVPVLIEEKAMFILGPDGRSRLETQAV
ncbi:MAG: metallophosphoesterase [Paracoccaceae bacterium]|nr:metallophosphoesterase [Paracoccaceae bacterium]